MKIPSSTPRPSCQVRGPRKALLLRSGILVIFAREMETTNLPHWCIVCICAYYRNPKHAVMLIYSELVLCFGKVCVLAIDLNFIPKAYFILKENLILSIFILKLNCWTELVSNTADGRLGGTTEIKVGIPEPNTTYRGAFQGTANPMNWPTLGMQYRQLGKCKNYLSALEY